MSYSSNKRTIKIDAAANIECKKDKSITEIDRQVDISFTSNHYQYKDEVLDAF